MGENVPLNREILEASVGLGDGDTVNKLQFIERLHAIGVSKYVALPQLVVVGGQSSGKSSVLQAITKLPFPVQDTLCTRFATEVSLRRAPGPESLSVTIKRPDEQEPEALNVPEFENSPFGSLEFRTEFANLLATASRQILGSQLESQVLSQATLHITAQGPNQINLTVVDLPGLVSATHPSSTNARSLVDRYIDNPRSIVLAVVVPEDPDTQEVLQIIRNIPDKENRVIGVMNKCDRRQEGADYWVLDAIKNERRTSNRLYLSRGWFGLRNRLPSETNTTNDDRDRVELAFFQGGVWPSLNQPTKLGIGNLRQALTRMHNDHITKSIPEFIPEIQRKLGSCQLKLAQLGSPRNTLREQRDCMVALASEFSRLSTDAIEGSYHNLPIDMSARVRGNVQKSLEVFKARMEEDFGGFPQTIPHLLTSRDEHTWRDSILAVPILNSIHEVIRDNRGREFNGEINPNVPRVLWSSYTDPWATRAVELIQDVLEGLVDSIDILVQEATKDEELQNSTMSWLRNELLTATTEAANDELAKLHDDEKNMWTLVPRHDRLRTSLYDDAVNEMATSLAGFAGFSPEIAATVPSAQWKNHIKLWLSNNPDVDGVLHTFTHLKAYYEIAMGRFIDNVGLQIVERHLLGKKSPLRMFTPSYVLNMAEEDPERLSSIAGENAEKTVEREDINQEIVTLKEALVEARSHGILRHSTINGTSAAQAARADMSGALA